MKKAFFLSISLVLCLASCKDFLKNEDQVQAEKADAEMQKYIKTQPRYTFLKYTNGSYFTTVQANPSGKKVAPGDEITFYYKIFLLNGTAIDSASESKKEPAVVAFSGLDVMVGFSKISNLALNISGLTDAVFKTKEGERSIALIPSNLALGNNSIGNTIPAYASFRLDLKVEKIRSELQQVSDLANSFAKTNSLNITESTEDGFRLIMVKANPTGVPVKQGVSTTVAYTGYFLNGTQFDKGEFAFSPGAGTTVLGFDRAVSKLKVGEKARAIFPSALAYGAKSSEKIPPYTPLVFDIEIIK
jgi:FKBP-type peptidyl-prolyl cis-trans isomerase